MDPIPSEAMRFPLMAPGMRYTVWQPAGVYPVPGKGEFAQRFAPGSWDRAIGQVGTINWNGRPIGRGRIIAADVAEDGSGVTITYEVMAEDEDVPTISFKFFPPPGSDTSRGRNDD